MRKRPPPLTPRERADMEEAFRVAQGIDGEELSAYSFYRGYLSHRDVSSEIVVRRTPENGDELLKELETALEARAPSHEGTSGWEG